MSTDHLWRGITATAAAYTLLSAATSFSCGRSVYAVTVLESCAQSNTMSLYRLNHNYLRSSCYPGEVVMPIII